MHVHVAYNHHARADVADQPRQEDGTVDDRQTSRLGSVTVALAQRFL